MRPVASATVFPLRQARRKHRPKRYSARIGQRGRRMLRRLLAPFLGPPPAPADSPQYQAGQIWQYRTRPGEEQSRLYIVKVETLSNGEPAFHLYLDNLKIPNARLPGHVQSELPHTPVSLQTLDQSVVKLR